ncbi:MAG: hypothetical protein KH745_04710, partial [Bilophila sp.]|nr:hypothetical protein [Bilophila sp.]
CLSGERHPFPSPNPSRSPSKTFDLIESLFPAFPEMGEPFGKALHIHRQTIGVLSLEMPDKKARPCHGIRLFHFHSTAK